MGMMKEFRQFATKGNVIDLAVGVIIGAAFGRIVDSLVKDITLPVINLLIGGKFDFSNKFIVLGDIPAGVPLTYEALIKAGVPLFAWGNFLTVSINFLILAFVIFWMVKLVNKARVGLESDKSESPATPAPLPEDIKLLQEIRDLLKTRPAAAS